MKLVIVSDIFGRTDALEEFAHSLNSEALIIDPYSGKYRNFDNEQTAYRAFMSEVGIDAYVALLNVKLEKQKVPLIVIGFSVGASALWHVLAEPEKLKVTIAIGYYGSQIRSSTHLTPQFPLELVVPQSESHFSVEELIEELKQKPNTTVRQTVFFHGFMNRYSNNFHQAAYQKELAWLQDKCKC